MEDGVSRACRCGVRGRAERTHAPLDVADAAPGVQPGAKRADHGQIRVDAGGFQCDKERAAEAVSQGLRTGQHELLDQLIRPQEQRLRDREPERLILLRTFS